MQVRIKYLFVICKTLTNGFCTRSIFIVIPVVSPYFHWGLLNKFKLSEKKHKFTYKTKPFLFPFLFTSMSHDEVKCTHQFIVVWSLIVRTGVRKQEHLRIGVNGEVQLDCVLMKAQELCHSLGLWFRLWELTAVCGITWIIGSPLSFRTK